MCQCQILVMFAVVESFIHMWRTTNAVETGKAGFQCCGKEYVPMSDPSDVCCGEVFYPYVENHQCCRNR